ncbi:DUF5994 family protein [Streptomyces sp. NBC_01190]|uniref:DUF5994 family protein n=1 Tax=Streptomyces sp. NBC_01190 TaxID=2903767 RepID=UPI00386DBC3A|nr:DUF5994 family protein [Streptomyces sp. NBC_01190]
MTPSHYRTTADLDRPAPMLASGLPAFEGPPVRLSLVPPDRGPVRIDGAWWPRTDDLTRELLPLLAALGVRWGRISHITVDGSAWSDGPPAIVLGGHTIRVNRSANTAHRDAICLVCRGVGRCDLIVVPPETARVQADRTLAAAVLRW